MDGGFTAWTKSQKDPREVSQETGAALYNLPLKEQKPGKGTVIWLVFGSERCLAGLTDRS